jgi:hypothetical protein
MKERRAQSISVAKRRRRRCFPFAVSLPLPHSFLNRDERHGRRQCKKEKERRERVPQSSAFACEDPHKEGGVGFTKSEKMRPLEEEEIQQVFEKLFKFVGKNLKNIVDRADQPHCFRLHKKVRATPRASAQITPPLRVARV